MKEAKSLGGTYLGCSAGKFRLGGLDALPKLNSKQERDELR